MSKKNKKEIIKKLIFEYKIKHDRLPKYHYLSEKSGMSTQEIETIVDTISREGFSKELEEKLKNRNKPKQKETKIQKIILDKNILKVFKVILLFIGCVSVYMSVFFTQNWLSETLSSTHSILLSLIMILFSVAAFQLIVFFYQHNKKTISAVFIFLFVIVTTFSIYSTVAGQYNSRLATADSRNKNKALLIAKKNYQKQFDKEEKEIMSRIESKRTELEIYIKKVLSYKKKENGFWLDRADKKRTEKDLLKLEKKLERLRKTSKKRLKVDENITAKTKDSYEWLESIFNISASMIQFWSSLFPAIFIDIIAPLSFSVVMFLDEKK